MPVAIETYGPMSDNPNKSISEEIKKIITNKGNFFFSAPIRKKI